MPRLDEGARRGAILSALERGNVNEVAKEYGVTRQSLHRLVREAQEKAEAEAEFWGRVRELVGRGR